MSALPEQYDYLGASSTGYWSRATPTTYSAEWLRDALGELDELRRLDNDWDSYGSPPPTPDAIRKARELILRLAEECAPTPSIRPFGGGGIQIESGTSRSELQLTVDPNGQAFFLALAPQGQIEEGELLSNALPNLLARVLLS